MLQTMPRLGRFTEVLQAELQPYFTREGRSVVTLELHFHNGVPYKVCVVTNKEVDLRPPS